MSMRTLVVATGNKHKVTEFGQILTDRDYDLRHLGQYPDVLPADETGDTFVANALEKALHAKDALGLPCCADDSGIGVAALDGAPGIRSARYAGDGATDEDNNALLLQRMRDVDDRTAYFSCAVVLVVPVEFAGQWFPGGSPRVEGAGWVKFPAQDAWVLTAETTTFGELLRSPRGSGGFGYDPLFLHVPSGQTYSEMTPDEKNAVSHRGRALRLMATKLAMGT